MEFLDSILSWLQGASNSAIFASIALGIEIILRLIKSEKPLSIMYLISDGLKKIGGIFAAAGALMDKVLPQRLK